MRGSVLSPAFGLSLGANCDGRTVAGAGRRPGGLNRRPAKGGRFRSPILAARYQSRFEARAAPSASEAIFIHTMRRST